MGGTTTPLPKPKRRTLAVLAVAGLVAAAGGIAAGVLGMSSAQAASGDLACGRPASASSNSANAHNAVDCVGGTIWQSSTTNPQWLQVDLGSTVAVDHVTVVWGVGYATSYKVRTSPDGSTWHTVVQNTTGQGGTETLTLPSGTNTRWIQLYLSQYAGTAGFMVDELEVFGSPGSSPSSSQATMRYEAENGVCQGTIDSDHTGFSGTGFCNTDNVLGATMTWTVTAATAGSATVTFRFSNGSSAARPATIMLNGAAVGTFDFPVTADWDTWASTSLTVSLNAGNNTIAAVATTSGGDPNLDYIDVGPASGGSPSPSPSQSPSRSPSPTPTSSGGRTVSVSTATQLSAALAGARPGDTISLAAGSYDGAFYATVSGTASAPITLTGPTNAVLSNSGGGCDPNVPSSPSGISYCGYGLHLNRVSYWHLNGFAVTSSNKGIVLDGSSQNVIDGVQVYNIGDEGVHFRTSSTDNILRDSSIHDTGRSQPGYGEGLYLGSAQSNWSKYGENGGSDPDRSDRNQALNNHFGPNIAAEHIDIKEGTVNGLVQGNTFDGRGISGQNYADSWIDVKGSGYTLTGNHGTYSGTILVDGYQVHQIVSGAGCGNAFHGNDSDLGGASGYAINVTDQSNCSANPNVVYSSNTVVNAGKGLTNITVTPGT